MEKFSNAFDVPQCKHNLGANLARRGAGFCYSESWPLIVVGRTKGEADGEGWRGRWRRSSIFPESDGGGVVARGHRVGAIRRVEASDGSSLKASELKECRDGAGSFAPAFCV